MGNKQAAQQEPVKRSPHIESLTRLYEELAEAVDGISTLKKEAFQNYFRSKVDDFDELLFSYIASAGGGNRNSVELTCDEFADGFETFLDKGKTSAGKLELYFSVFSDGESSMSFTDLVEMFHISRYLAMAVTDSAAQGPKPDTETIADVWARSIMGDEGTHVDCNRFCGWAKQNCPRVFDGIHCWVIKMLLYRGHLPDTTPEGFPAIPHLTNPLDSQSLLNTETLWILSTILPPCFLGSLAQTSSSGGSQTATADEKKAKPLERCKEWTLLYDSVQHGQSLNRFKHHCMAYHGPTVTLLRLGKEGLLIVAIDVEWRESSSSWGNSDCRVIQVRPKFQVLRAGPNLIFFNERARGLPSGIVLGQTSRPCVTLDTGLSAAKLHYQTDLTPQTINKIEVWGCGGQGLKEKQEKQQQWERKQAEKLQKVKRPGRWDDNPDKAILEMAGVTTNHSQR
ncbi:hypothetical protein ACROYT_G008254 [Oculina patagonica]